LWVFFVEDVGGFVDGLLSILRCVKNVLWVYRVLGGVVRICFDCDGDCYDFWCGCCCIFDFCLGVGVVVCWGVV